MKIEKWLGEDNKIGIDIFNKKYLQKDETFAEWLDRITAGSEEFKQALLNKEFLTAGRILSNRGLQSTGKKITYSNCYVIAPPEDDIASIYEAAMKLARTFSYGGGAGIDISKLAPRGARVNNTAGETSGSVSFMDLYSMTTALIGQNGRRGALMISLDCSHPDLEEFISVKSDLEKVTKANISVKFSDAFMQAVVNNDAFTLSFTRKATGEKIEKIINAREVFKVFAEMNWNYAEPGALFWDTITQYNLLSNNDEFEYAGVNPCAEEPLPAGGSCLLGSINLAEFVNNPFSDHSSFDFDGFKDKVQIAVRNLNVLLDEGLPLHPLEEQRETVGNWRQIGLGPMGIADMLIKLGIRYGSEESINLCEEIAFTMANYAIRESARIAKEQGPFPKCNIQEIISTPFFLANTDEKTKDLVIEYGLANSQLLTCAPTGTISTMLGVSGGIEPIFANYYTRKTESLHNEDVFYKIYTPLVEKYMNEKGIKDEKDLPDFFATSENIHHLDRIQMQAVWQRHIDASISSTVNVPESFTKEDVLELYVNAWENGLKGITIFRAGCARGAILTTGLETVETTKIERGDWKAKAEDTVYFPRKIKTGCGKITLFIGWSEEEQAIQDLYIERTGQGGCEKNIKSTIIAMSGMLRLGGSVMNIEKAFEGLGACNSFVARRKDGFELSPGGSCGSAILYQIKDFMKEKDMNIAITKKKKQPTKNSIEDKKVLCPDCGEEIHFAGGCVECRCGWSKCD